jgi:hypothetical protein
MADFKNYSDARQAIKNLIESKESDLSELESQISNLKKTRRLLDEEFNNECHQKRSDIG